MTGTVNLKSLLTLLLAALLLTGPAQAQGEAPLRFIHLDVGSPPVDIYVNGELVASNLRYGEYTSYVYVPGGDIELSAYLSATSVLLSSDLLFLAEEPAAILLSSRDDAFFHISPEQVDPLSFGRARLSVINATDDVATLSIVTPTDESALAATLVSGAFEGPVEVDAGVHKITIHAADAASDEAILQISEALTAGAGNLLVIHGRPSDPKVLNVPAAADGLAGSARVRFVHAVAGAAPVDLRINDQLIVPALSFATPSEHIALPSGSHRVAFNLGQAEIMSERLDIRAGQMNTVVLMGSTAGLRMRSFDDAPSGIDESSAVVSLINAIPGSLISRLQLESGSIVAFDVAFGETGDAARIVPGRQSMTIFVEIGDDRGEVEVAAHYFSGGSYYNLIALAGGVFSAPRLLIAETSLQRHVRATMSLIAAEDEIQPVASAEDTVTDSSEAEPIPGTEPQDEATSAPDEADDIEGDLAQIGAETAVEASDEVAAVIPYAIVVVDQDAALHMRLFPSSESMSLGLLPAESNLMVLGRRGLTDFDFGDPTELPAYLSDYTVDAATGLLPYQDMPAADSWLFVLYKTPDGGALYGWVNALYLNVFDQSGQRQRLASLPLVRQNQIGSAYNTDIRPPELSDHVTARVSGLSASALLNLRMGNDANTEVLTQVAPDTILGFIGLDVAEEWAYVDYESEQGNLVKGWASMDFIQLLLNGQPVPIDTMRALDPTTVRLISGSVSGVIQPMPESDVAQPDLPTEGIVGEVNVNFDSALHLRRYPDATSESLSLIPPGTELSLDGIYESGDWYKVQYDGEGGWVAADYLALTMDGRQYASAFLEGQLPRLDDLGR